VTELLVHRMTVESDSVLSVELVDPGGAELPTWEPGAHVDLELVAGLVRQYSLCGDPARRDRYRLGVLCEPVSRGGSAHVHTKLRPGDRVRLTGPRNNFVLEPAERYLFLAGGIGITPILPMAAAAEAAGMPWRLVYGGRTRSTMAFVGELAGYGDRVTLVPENECGLLDLDALLGEPQDGVAVYCCGPEGLIAAVEQRCAAWPSGALHVERFAAKPTAEPEGGERAFEVVCERSGTTVPVSPDRSIVDALEAAGIAVATSCREGICGTCETKVLGGVPDHRDSLLSESERAASDTMMICVSRAASRQLVLDL